MIRRRVGTMVLSSLALTTGCGDPLDLGQVIERTRVLGARVSVEGDEERASPAPDETVSVDWLVISPGAPPLLDWGFWACAEAAVRSGPPTCLSQPFASFDSEVPSPDAPLLTMTLPGSSALGEVTSIAVAGAICDDTDAQIDPEAQTAQCANGEGTRVSVEIPIFREGTPNRNPSFGDEVIRIGDAEWAESAMVPAQSGAACSGLGALEKPISEGKQRITIDLAGDDRERLDADDSLLDRERETLTVSHFSTAGELDRQFSIVESDEEAQRLEVQWTPPDEVGDSGSLVQFVFVMRDGRGGTDWTFRYLCATRR